MLERGCPEEAYNFQIRDARGETEAHPEGAGAGLGEEPGDDDGEGGGGVGHVDEVGEEVELGGEGGDAFGAEEIGVDGDAVVELKESNFVNCFARIIECPVQGLNARK